MNVGRGQQHRLHVRKKRIVVNNDARRRRGELHRSAFRRVINDVANEINRPTQSRLRRQSAMRHVEASISDDSKILRAGIGFDAVIVNVPDVVADDVRRNRHDGIVGPTVGVTVRRVIDSIVKVLDTVVRDHMPRAKDLHSVLGKQRLREARQILPGAADPTHQTGGIVAPDKHVVRNVEVTGAAPIGEDAAADIFQLGVFQSETDGAQDALAAEEEGDVGISDGDPFDVVIVGSGEVE